MELLEKLELNGILGKIELKWETWNSMKLLEKLESNGIIGKIGIKRKNRN